MPRSPGVEYFSGVLEAELEVGFFFYFISSPRGLSCSHSNSLDTRPWGQGWGGFLGYFGMYMQLRLPLKVKANTIGLLGCCFFKHLPKFSDTHSLKTKACSGRGRKIALKVRSGEDITI